MKTSLKIFILMLSLLPLGSCMRDDFGDEIPGGDGKDVMLKIALPFAGAQKPVTRAIGANEEMTVTSVDLLAFRVEDDGRETFLYMASAAEIVAGAPSAVRNFKASVRLNDHKQRFVVIANARDEVETLIGGRVSDGWTGVEKEDMLARLSFGLAADHRWNAAGTADHTPIPMWGESAAVKVDAGVTSITPGDSRISLLRMVAKIEVALDESNAGETTDVFKLKSVHLYNISTTGRIVPGQANLNHNVARQASLPAQVKSLRGPVEYSGGDKFSAGKIDVAMRGAVYLFETAAKNKDNQLEETCIVVGGLYHGEETYYRLDFFADDGKTHVDILRNHHYDCNITAVKGPGAPTPEIAFRSKSLNLKTQVLVWDEGAIRDVNIDGQNFLGVSQSRFLFDGEEHGLSATDNILKITTDVPGGWKADLREDKDGINPVPMDWIKLDRYAGTGGNAPEELRLLVAPNSGKTPRTAWMHIKAGRLTYLVEVKQSESDKKTMIYVSPDHLLFDHKGAATDGNRVEVFCERNGAEAPNEVWTLTTDADWLWLSPLTTTDKKHSLTGTGKMSLAVYADANPDKSMRTATIYLNGNQTNIVVTVDQEADMPDLPSEGFGTPPVGTETYVGAFWRANQRGERLIRIEAGANSANYGDWTATVAWIDGRWKSAAEIMLDRATISNESKGIFSDNSPSDAEAFQLNVNSTGVHGTVSAADRFITFRIGLKSLYTPTEEHPARYAVILLSYKNNTVQQKIFLRQGEDADYVLTADVPVNSGGIAKRTHCAKFSPYNLTVDGLDNTIEFINEYPYRAGTVLTVAPGKGIFTKYPTQTGAFWYWAFFNDGNGASNPYTSVMKNFGMSVTRFWSQIGATNETSPSGYRRPVDGSGALDKADDGSDISKSEVRQSLWIAPQKGYNQNSLERDNSAWGYYADGFFDRRRIVNKTAVADRTTDIAHIGRLFFNPHKGSIRENASLFFPATGTRRENSGNLQNNGASAIYWTATSSTLLTTSTVQTSNASGLRIVEWKGINEPHMAMWNVEKNSAAMIRPVKDSK